MRAKCHALNRRIILDRSSRSGMAGESMAAILRDPGVGDVVVVENVPASTKSTTMLKVGKFNIQASL